MARAGQQVLREDGRLEDRISVGVLARAFPREAVEEVIDAAGAREQRNRVLPAWLTVYFVLALALFMDMGAGRVMRRLAGTLAWAAQGITVTIPSEEALSNARARLGPVPLRLLFEKTAGLLAGPGTPGAFWRGLRLVSLDGTTLDVQDTEMKGAGVVLRSRTPDGAAQEIWALLCAYHAIREMICAAAALAARDPLRISFASALDTVRGPVGDPAAFPP
ncbi:MAG: transposase domain-containing protein [Streptosporangiaceae bacterium]